MTIPTVSGSVAFPKGPGIHQGDGGVGRRVDTKSTSGRIRCALEVPGQPGDGQGRFLVVSANLRTPTGFEEAFDGLYATAFRVALRSLGNPTAAEDVAVETLARAFAHWGKIGDQPWREGWVVRVASNLAFDAARARSRFSDTPPEETGREDEDVAARVSLAQELARLPRRQREVLALRHLAGHSEAETAEGLRVSEGSVKTHLHRGLAAMRSRLGVEMGGMTGDVR